jgi:hypothetical protein
MHQEYPNVVRLQVHLENQQSVTWDQGAEPDMAEVLEQSADRDTTLTAYFKANRTIPTACQHLYQDFPAHFVWNKKKWKIRERGFAIGRMYYAHPTSGERFYLRMLLTAVRGATSFANLREFNGVQLASYREACLARGLLTDDNEWKQCLQEAGEMQTGRQLRDLFATILRDCAPSDPQLLWIEFREKICDDLSHDLRRRNIIPDPTEEQVCIFLTFDGRNH